MSGESALGHPANQSWSCTITTRRRPRGRARERGRGPGSALNLARLVEDPDYADASIGVLCLFSEQVELVQQLVAETIDESEWEEHALVVVNPDGFQGDERDVVLYSLSYDDGGMSRAAISARHKRAHTSKGCSTLPSRGREMKFTSFIQPRLIASSKRMALAA